MGGFGQTIVVPLVEDFDRADQDAEMHGSTTNSPAGMRLPAGSAVGAAAGGNCGGNGLKAPSAAAGLQLVPPTPMLMQIAAKIKPEQHGGQQKQQQQGVAKGPNRGVQQQEQQQAKQLFSSTTAGGAGEHMSRFVSYGRGDAETLPLLFGSEGIAAGSSPLEHRIGRASRDADHSETSSSQLPAGDILMSPEFIDLDLIDHDDSESLDMFSCGSEVSGSRASSRHSMGSSWRSAQRHHQEQQQQQQFKLSISAAAGGAGDVARAGASAGSRGGHCGSVSGALSESTEGPTAGHSGDGKRPGNAGSPGMAFHIPSRKPLQGLEQLKGAAEVEADPEEGEATPPYIAGGRKGGAGRTSGTKSRDVGAGGSGREGTAAVRSSWGGFSGLGGLGLEEISGESSSPAPAQGGLGQGEGALRVTEEAAVASVTQIKELASWAGAAATAAVLAAANGKTLEPLPESVSLDEDEPEDQTLALCPVADILSGVSSMAAGESPLEVCSSSEDPSDWSSARPRKLQFTHAAAAMATAGVPCKVKGRIPSSKVVPAAEEGSMQPAGVVAGGERGKEEGAPTGQKMALLRERFAKAQAPPP